MFIAGPPASAGLACNEVGFCRSLNWRVAMTLVMGVLNVTPDSFYDGGHWEDKEAATVRGCQMVEEGADIVDVGGESTRPGAVTVTEGEEVRRVVPVIKELAPPAGWPSPDFGRYAQSGSGGSGARGGGDDHK